MNEGIQEVHLPLHLYFAIKHAKVRNKAHLYLQICVHYINSADQEGLIALTFYTVSVSLTMSEDEASQKWENLTSLDFVLFLGFPQNCPLDYSKTDLKTQDLSNHWPLEIQYQEELSPLKQK